MSSYSYSATAGAIALARAEKDAADPGAESYLGERGGGAGEGIGGLQASREDPAASLVQKLFQGSPFNKKQSLLRCVAAASVRAYKRASKRARSMQQRLCGVGSFVCWYLCVRDVQCRLRDGAV